MSDASINAVTVELDNHIYVTFKVIGNIFDMTEGDRDFIFGIIDRIGERERRVTTPQAQGVKEDDGETQNDVRSV